MTFFHWAGGGGGHGPSAPLDPLLMMWKNVQHNSLQSHLSASFKKGVYISNSDRIHPLYLMYLLNKHSVSLLLKFLISATPLKR